MKLRPFLWLLFSVNPCPAQSLPEALDFSSGQWDAGRFPAWRAVSSPVAADGTDAAVSDGGNGQLQALQLRLRGPGELRYKARLHDPLGTLSVAAIGTLGFYPPDGTNVPPMLSGTAAWQEYRVSIPRGPAIVAWRHTRGQLADGETCSAWVDEVSYAAAVQPAGIASATGAENITWSAGPGVTLSAWQESATAGGLSYLTAERDETVPGVFLRASLPAGWYSIRWRGNAALAVTPASRQTDSAGDNQWFLSYGYMDSPGELTWEVQGGSTGARAVAVESAVAGLMAPGDSLDTPGRRVWTVTEGSLIAPLGSSMAPDGMDALALRGAVESMVDGPALVELTCERNVIPFWEEKRLFPPASLTATLPSLIRKSALIPPGRSLLRLGSQPETGPALIADQVSIRPLQLVDATEATDWPGLTWTLPAGPAAAWYGVKDSARSADGADCLRAGPLREAATASAAWSGAGSIEFHYLSNGTTSLALSVDQFSSVSLPAGGWFRVRAEGLAGQHTSRWDFQPGSQPAFREGFSQIDDVRWIAGDTSFSDAADTTPAAWMAAGAGLWTVTSDSEAQGGACLASPALMPGQTAWIDIDIPATSDVTFHWRGSGISDYTASATTFQPVAGSVTASLRGESQWIEQTVRAGAGTLRWSVKCDGTLAAQAGAVKVDHVRIVPLTVTVTPQPLPDEMAAAMGIPGSGAALLNSNPVLLGPADSQDGVSAVRLPGTPQLSITAPGPFELSFWWRATRSVSIADGPTLAGTAGMGWKRAVFCRAFPGPYSILLSSAWTGTGNHIDLDGMVLSPYGAPGTFSGSMDAPADCRIYCSDLGTGHALADTDTVRSPGNPTVRLGSDCQPVTVRKSGGTFRYWQQHSDPAISGLQRGPVNEWYSAASISDSGDILVSGSNYPGWHLWLDGAVREPGIEISDILRSDGIVWTPSPAEAWGVHPSSGFGSDPAFPDAVLEASVTGPGFLYADFFWGRVILGGVTEVQTGTLLKEISAGTQTVGFTRHADSPSLFPRATTTFAPRVTAEAGLDLEEAPEIGVISIPGAWSGISSRALAFDGQDAVLSPPLTAQPLTMEFSVNGPGEFAVRSRYISGNATLQIALDTEAPVWLPATVPVPAGMHTVRILATGGGGLNDRVLLDMVSWRSASPLPMPEMADALDTPGLSWTTHGSLPFTRKVSAGAAGGSVAASPLLRNEESTWLETEVIGPGYLLYDRVITSSFASTTQEGLTVMANGVTLPASSIGTKARIARIPTGGVNVIRFNFRNQRFLANEPAVATVVLDDVLFVPDGALVSGSLDNFLPVPGVSWGTPDGSTGGWRGLDGGSRGRMLVCPPRTEGIFNLPFTASAPGSLIWKGSRPDIRRMDTGMLLQAYLTGTPPDDTGAYFDPTRGRLLFRNDGLSGFAPGTLRGFNWTPNELSLEEVLDVPGQVWQTGGDAPWKGYGQVVTGTAHDLLSDQASCGQTGDGQSSWIETTFAGPCRITWNGVLSAETGDAAEVSVNGVIVSTHAGTGSTLSLHRALRSDVQGPVTVRWTYRKNAALSGGSDRFYLNYVTVASDSPEDPAAALDLKGMTFTQGSNAGLRFVAENSPMAITGPSLLSVRGPSSMSTPPSQLQTWIDASAAGPGLISFGGMAVTVTSSGPAVFSNRPTNDSASLTRYWIPLSTSAPATVRIQSNLASAADIPQLPTAAQSSHLDGLRFDPPVPVSSLDSAGVKWTTGGVPWAAYGDNSSAAALSPGLQVDQTSWLEAECTGPGTLEFLGSGSGTMTVNGVTELSSGSSTVFTSAVLLPAGITRIRWQCIRTRSIGAQQLFLHNFRFTPGMSSMQMALGAGGLVYVLREPAAFESGTADPPFPGQTYLELSGRPVPSFVSVITPEAGTLAYWQKSRPSSAITTYSWIRKVMSRMDGPARFSFRLASGSSSEALQLAAFQLQTLPRIAFSEAVDSDCVTWEVPASGIWSGSLTSSARQGDDTLNSGPATSIAPAEISAAITGPALLRFWQFGGAGFSVDGQMCLPEQSAGFGESPSWEQVRVELSPGPHRLTWRTTTGVHLDAFDCTGVLSLLPYIPGQPAALVSYEAAWISADGFLHAGAGPVTKRNLAVVMSGPAILFEGRQMPSQAAFLSSVGSAGVYFVPGHGQFTALIAPDPLKSRLLFTGTALQSVGAGEVLGFTVTGTTGWRAYEGGGLRFVYAPPAPSGTAMLDTLIPGGVHLVWRAFGPLQLWENGTPGFGTLGPIRVEVPRSLSWAPAVPSQPVFFTELTTIPLTAQNDLRTWLTAAGLPATTSPAADPDQDGTTLFSEFVFGGNARGPETSDLEFRLVERDGLRWPAIDFTALADGHVFHLERSFGSGWLALTTTIEVLESGFPYSRYRISTTSDSNFHRSIFRVKAQPVQN